MPGSPRLGSVIVQETPTPRRRPVALVTGVGRAAGIGATIAARLLAAVSAIAVAAGTTALCAPAQAAVVAPTILLPNMTVAEGDSGTAAFTVNVGLTAPNPFTHPVTVEVVDYTSIPLPGGGGPYGNARTGGQLGGPLVPST